MRKYKVNEGYFDVLNENSAYWLGFLYADGYVRLRNGRSGTLKLKLKVTDRNHIEKFLNDIDSDHPIKCGIDGKSKFCLTSVNSNKMVKRLFELGCVNNKTFKIRLPDLTQNLMSHFIRGYFDGDGSISKVKNRPNSFVLNICSNKNFNQHLVEYLGYGKIYEDINYSVITISKINDVKNFRDYIYTENCIKLDRKYEVFKQIDDNYKRDYSITKNKKKYIILSPDNERFITEHLRKFCDENNLTYSTMSNLSRGIGKTNKGWKCSLFID